MAEEEKEVVDDVLWGLSVTPAPYSLFGNLPNVSSVQRRVC